MSVSVFEGIKKSWLELCFQSILGWLRVFVGMADHSKTSNSSNLSDLSANQKLNRKCFGFRHNNKTRFGSSDLEKNTLSSTFKRPSPTHLSNQSSLTRLIPSLVRNVFLFLLCIFPIHVQAAVQWNAIGTPVFIQPVVIDPKTPDTLYAGTLSGDLLKSLDGGLNWSTVYVGSPFFSIRTIAIAPNAPSILYMGVGTGGILKSTNGGANWVRVNAGLTSGRVYTIVIDPKTSSTIYAGTVGGGIFKSTDSGLNWVPINAGLSANKNITAIVIDPMAPSTLYAGDWLQGLYKSTNKGRTWVPVGSAVFLVHAIPIGSTGGSGYQITSIAINPVSPSIIYVGTVAGGVLKSKDNGLNWTIINQGLTAMGIESIAINPLIPATLYIGTRLGIFKAADVAITNFTVIDNPVSGLDFTVNLSAPLPTGYTLAVNFDNQQGGWLLQTNAGGHIPLVKGLNGTTYTLNYVLNKPGLRSYQVGIFGPNGQLVGAYFPYKTCLTPTCLATIERTNNIGIPSTRGSQQFKNVDVASGNYYFSSTDMSVPGGKGPSFNLTRSYNSLGMKSVVQGTNQTNPNPLTINDYNVKPNPWTFAHDMQARFMDDKSETGLTTNTNRKIVLGPMEDGSLLYYFKDMDQKWYTLTAGNFKQLIQNANGSFTLYTQGDRIYQFADPAGVAKGRLNRIENRIGLALTYIYNASNVLTSVTDANNHSYSFTHGTNALGTTLRVTDFTGRFVEYTFDANGMISQMRNMRGKFDKYTYGTTGSNIYRIAKIRDPRNTATAQISLTSENIIGRVLSLVDGANNTTSFVYGKDTTVGEATGVKRPAVDGLNHNLVYVLDTATFVGASARTKVLKRLDAKDYIPGATFSIAANDVVTTYSFKSSSDRNHLEENTLVLTTDDPNKNHTTIAYDPAVGGGRPQTISNAVVGNTAQRTSTATYTTIPAQVNLKPVATVQQSGVAAATQYQIFTPTGKAQDIIDPAGNKTSRVFNPTSGQMTQTSNPRQTLNPALGNTKYTYDAAGNLTQITDALGNKTIKTYDTLGRIKTELSPLGLTTTYTYDANGNVLTRIEQGVGGINYKTTNTYDANDNLLSTTDPLLHVTNYTYDNLNRKTKESYTVGGVPYVRSFAYDAIGRLKTVTNERGFATQTHYTARSQVKYKVDPLLNTTVTYTYDNNGNVKTVKDAENRTVTTTYDALNRKTQTTDSKGNVQKWTYNAAGQIATYTDARLKLTSYLYDAVGNVTQVTDAKNGITRSTYDGNGNVLTVIDPNIHTTTYAYDALDRRISTTLHDGRKWTYTYDANGNMLTEITPTGEKTVKTYDPLNRVASLKEYAVNGATITRSISYTYDANDNVLTEVSGANTIAYTYDEINRITSVIDQYGKTVSYGYDKAGNRTTLTYPGNNTVLYVYDKAGRLNSLKDWLNKTTTYTRNFAGQVTQVLNGNGSKTTYLYDTAGRLTNLTNIDGNGATISSQSMTLDGAGNITNSTMNLPLLPTLPPSTGIMAYDLTNRLTSAGANSYTPDLAGRTITETKGAVQTIYQFDIKDHITSIKQGATTLSSYGYDLKNNRISQIQNGTETRYVIDQLASLPNVIAETNNLGVISTYYIYGEGLVSQITAGGVSHYYHYDPTGNTLALTDAAGNVSDTFAYAPYGFTTSTGLTHNPFKFVGKYGVMDDGNSLHYMRARYYKEDIKRFVSLDALHGDMMTPQKLNRYAYALGNPVNFIDSNGREAKSYWWHLGKTISDTIDGTKSIFATQAVSSLRKPIFSAQNVSNLSAEYITKYVKNSKDYSVSFRFINDEVQTKIFRYAERSRYSNITKDIVSKGLAIVTTGVFTSLRTYDSCKSDITSSACVKTITKLVFGNTAGAIAGGFCVVGGPPGVVVCAVAASATTDAVIDAVWNVPAASQKVAREYAAWNKWAIEDPDKFINSFRSAFGAGSY